MPEKVKRVKVANWQAVSKEEENRRYRTVTVTLKVPEKYLKKTPCPTTEGDKSNYASTVRQVWGTWQLVTVGKTEQCGSVSIDALTISEYIEKTIVLFSRVVGLVLRRTGVYGRFVDCSDSSAPHN